MPATDSAVQLASGILYTGLILIVVILTKIGILKWLDMGNGRFSIPQSTN